MRARCFAGRLLFAVVMTAGLAAAGCGEQDDGSFQGYVEGEFVYAASKFSGRLDELKVRRGRTVRPGDVLYVLEHRYEKESVLQAEANLRGQKSTLKDMEKGLRQEELDQIRAGIVSARAQAKYTSVELERQKKLYRQGAVAKDDLDSAVAGSGMDLAAVREYEAKLATGELTERIDRIDAQKNTVEAARYDLAHAGWDLDQKTGKTIVGGLVFDLLHYKGEWVPAGSPVVVLLPPENIKIRFFVPETTAGSLRIGQELTVDWDGAEKPVRAEITYISPEVEYTPPVIYSQGFRSKLVFMIEARPDPEVAKTMHPGQPVDVRLFAPEPAS